MTTRNHRRQAGPSTALIAEQVRQLAAKKFGEMAQAEPAMSVRVVIPVPATKLNVLRKVRTLAETSPLIQLAQVRPGDRTRPHAIIVTCHPYYRVKWTQRYSRERQPESAEARADI